MADQDRHDRSGRSDQDFDRRVEASAYAFARQRGSNDATARLAAKLARDQLEIDVRRFAELFRRVELEQRAKQRPTLKLEHQLELWRMRGKGWEDPSQDVARAQAMYAAGATPSDVLDAQFPYRRDLITRGRPDLREQVEYANQMAATSALIDQTVQAHLERARSGTAANVSDDPSGEHGHSLEISGALTLDDSDVAPLGCREYAGCPALRHLHMTHAQWFDKATKARLAYGRTGSLSKAARSAAVSVPTIRKWFLWLTALEAHRTRA